MIEPLDPEHLTPAASLNRMRIVDLPGLALEDGIRSQFAFDLLSAGALVDLMRRDAAGLGLTPGDFADGSRAPRLLDQALRARNPAIQAAADGVAASYGRRLAYLILTLKRGDAVNRAARADWDDSYWDHWAGIRQVWLGGGLAGGQLGARVRQGAAEYLRTAGLPHFGLHVAAHPAVLPLIGAARSVPAGAPAAIVFDFGQTAIKRAQAVYQDGALIRLRPLPTIRSGFGNASGDLSPEEVAALGERMVAVFAETWRAAQAEGITPAPVLVASLAAYIRDNQPLLRQGGPYSELRILAPSAGAWLAERVSSRLGRRVEVVLVHDGTAAARAYAGEPRSAVITLGTALGIGFPPPAAAVHPLAPGFRVDALPAGTVDYIRGE
jgi:hypothetical protein